MYTYKLSGADAFTARWEERQQPSVKNEETLTRDIDSTTSADSSGLRVCAVAGTTQTDCAIASRSKESRFKKQMQALRELFVPRRAMFE